MKRNRCAGAERGYILIFALAVLLFLVGTVTGAAYALRLDAAEVARQREQLQAELRLRGALQYALAQFTLGVPAANAGSPPSDAGAKPRGWRFEPSTQAVQIDGAEIAATLENPGGIADPNSFDERAWSSYFAALPVAGAEQARRWAAAVISWKERIGRANGRGGFAAIDDLLALDALPVAVRYGGRSVRDDSGEVIPGLPGMPELFVVGAGEKVLDVNRAALPLIAAYTGASAESLAAFALAREQRKLTAEEAQRLLGPRAGPALQDKRTDEAFRLTLTTASGAHRMVMVAHLRYQDKSFRLLSTRIGPAAAAEQ